MCGDTEAKARVKDQAVLTHTVMHVDSRGIMPKNAIGARKEGATTVETLST